MSQEAPREIELKLDVNPERLFDLRSALATRMESDGATKHLVSVYYDTEEHELWAHGMTLRIRTIGERHIQTLKAGDAGAGLSDRSEWESDVTDGIDLAAIADTPAAALLDDVSKLQAVFQTAIERTTWPVTIEGSEIEIALDHGRISAGTAEQLIAELELELKHGDPKHLFTLLRELSAAGDLRIGVQAKSERGFALAREKTPRSHKADMVHLTPKMSAGGAFQTIMQGCIRQFRLNEPLMAARQGTEPLHQARVALRRLRSALSLFKPVVQDDKLSAIAAHLQSVSRELGEARNLDVYLERGAKSEAECEAPGDGARFIEEIQRRRDAAYDSMLATLDGQAFRTLMLDLLEWIAAGSWVTTGAPAQVALRDKPVKTAAASILDRRWRQVIKKGKHLAELDPHERHRVRIAAKKLRYASDFFTALAVTGKERRRHTDFIAALADLQQHLGDLNDIQAAHDLALTFSEAAPPVADPTTIYAAAHLSGREDARVEDLLRAAEKAHRAVCEAKRFWKTWA